MGTLGFKLRQEVKENVWRRGWEYWNVCSTNRIPEDTEESLGRKVAKARRSIQDVENTVGDNRCPRRLGILGARDAIRCVPCEGMGPDHLPEANGRSADTTVLNT